MFQKNFFYYFIILSILTIWLSYKGIFYRFYYILYPSYLPDTNNIASTSLGILNTCSNISFRESISYYNIHDISIASKIVDKLNVPVIFRNFKENPIESWNEVSKPYQSYLFKQPKVEIKSFGNIFMAGTKTMIDIVENVTLSEILERDSKSAKYASFTSFLTDESIEKLVGNTVKFQTDTNFISNFYTDVVASPIHSTTYVKSFSLQLRGHKLWVWISPEEMEDVGIISSHTANYHYRGSEADYFRKAQHVLISVVREGDLLVFPPLWGHSVITQSGPNVMLNFRQRQLFSVFLSSPFRFIETVFSTFVLSNGKHSTAAFNPLTKTLWSHRDIRYKDPNWVPFETPCKDFYKKMINSKE